MAINAKHVMKPKVVLGEMSDDSSDDSDFEQEESEAEPGDDLVEIKEEEDDEYETFNDSFDGMDDDVECKDECKDEISSSDDSDILMEEDSDGEESTLKRKGEDSLPTKKKAKRAKVMEDDSEESETDVDEEEETEGEDEDDAEGEDEDAAEDAKSGLASVMAKILSNKGDDEAILSKAKKDHARTKKAKSEEFEFVDAEGNVKKDVKIEVKEEEVVDPRLLDGKRERERENLSKLFKLKPDFEADRVKERNLRIIATQGVVQLFTAIEKHKASVKKEIGETKSLVDREEISSSEMKKSFLDILDKEGERIKKFRNATSIKKEFKSKLETKDEPIDLPTGTKTPKWNVFADNFYKEPTLHGWDAESDNEN